MREKFLVGIVGENLAFPVPSEAVDFIDFSKKLPDGKLILSIKFCPFCGKADTGPLRVVVTEEE